MSAEQESFISHLIELRQRLVRAVSAVLVLFVVLLSPMMMLLYALPSV